jgi:hypothetical protein
MDFSFTPEQLRTGLIFYIIIFISLTLRAYAQAWLADRLGDPTPRQEGRVTLYPPAHVDWLGTVILPLICIFYLLPRISQANFAFFLAWTLPIPINPANFANPQRGFLYTQFAGLGMSVLLSLFAAVAGGFLYGVDPKTAEVFITLISVNAMLMFLDFLPVPPLPGGVLLKHWGWISEERFWAIARWSGLALLVAFNLPPVRVFIAVGVTLIQLPFRLLYEIILRFTAT